MFIICQCNIRHVFWWRFVFSRRPTARYRYLAVAKSFGKRACVPVSSESCQAMIMLKVSHFRQTTCCCACCIKHPEHIALEVDVLDSNYVLSTTLKRLLTRRIILYASSLGISREVGVAVTFTWRNSFSFWWLHSLHWHEHGWVWKTHQAWHYPGDRVSLHDKNLRTSQFYFEV